MPGAARVQHATAVRDGMTRRGPVVDTYEQWLDAMPTEDVRRRIERLEQELDDLRVLERLHATRHAAQEGASEEGTPPT